MDKWEESFLRDLVQLDTNSDEKRDYSECAKVLKAYCEEAGLAVEVFDSKHEGIPQPNVVATLDAHAKRTVLLCTHYDVVPAGDSKAWTRPPFALTVEKDRMYGRGTSDDKGNIVASVSAARELARRGSAKVNLRILISPNEETGGEWGIDYLVNGPPKIRGDFAIVVDSSPSYVSIGASGVLSGRVTVHGTQGHAGYPFKFNNAIHLAIPLLSSLLDYQDVRRKVVSSVAAPPGSPYQTLWGRFSLTVLSAGSKTNIIPGTAEVSFDCRLIPEERPDDAMRELEAFLVRVREEVGVEAEITFLNKSSGWASDPTDPMIRLFHEAVREVADPDIQLAGDLGGNDGDYFMSVGIPTACYGTIYEECNFHGVDEFLRLEDYEKVKRSIMRFAEKC
ncbi:MAG: M20/M25/M40 family metallo-hydrolase [Candidatus Thorarchaeota archaeon]|nr:M20/M25/M40 family metallo-hydrolase [Candidatus Thorarchaeota archaeon]